MWASKAQLASQAFPSQKLLPATTVLPVALGEMCLSSILFPPLCQSSHPSGVCVSKCGYKTSQTSWKTVMAKKRNLHAKIKQNPKPWYIFKKEKLEHNVFSMSLIPSFFSAWEVGRAVFLCKYSQLKGGPSEIP